MKTEIFGNWYEVCDQSAGLNLAANLQRRGLNPEFVCTIGLTGSTRARVLLRYSSQLTAFAAWSALRRSPCFVRKPLTQPDGFTDVFTMWERDDTEKVYQSISWGSDG